MAATIDVAKLVTQIIADTTKWKSGLGSATKTATSFSEKVGRAFANVGVQLLVDGAKQAAKSILGLAKSFGQLAINAAPLQGIGAIFKTNAAEFGVSIDAMRKAAAGTVSDFEMMRQANVALTGAGTELGKAFGERLPNLLEAARAAARATGQDAGFLFESLVTGVKRASPMLIDNTGIVLKIGEANEAMAKSLGKTVEQLTAQEKSIAILNATTEAGAKIVEKYGSAQLTVAEQLQRSQAVFQNFKDQAGLALQPVLSNLMGRFNDLAQRVLPPLVSLFETKIAPALDILVDKLGGLGTAAVDAGESFLGKFGSKLLTAAENALMWGIKISTELATGLVKGAAQALTAAMQFIGNLLSSWLSPGSPPKVAPQIGAWGQEAFGQYLHGMTKASFGILEGVQGPLQKTLDTLVDMGAIGEKTGRKAFKGLTGDLTVALTAFQKTGKVGSEIFEKLEAVGGQFGKELSGLARKQFALAAATRQVQEAEENLNKARKASEEARGTVDKLADEYNKLLAAGADPALLEAKKAEYDAAQDQLALSEDQVVQAEEQKAAAEEQVDPLQEQVDVQQRVLDQLLQMADAQKEVTESALEAMGAMAGAGAGADTEIKLPKPKIPKPDFSELTKGFEDAKADILEKFGGMFKPVTDAWENDIKPTLDTLGEKWTTFTGIVKKFYDEKVKPVVEKIKKFLPPGLAEKIGEWAGIILVAGIAVKFLLVVLALLTSPIVLLGIAIGILIILWEKYGEQVTITANQIIFLITYALDKAITTLKQMAFIIEFTVVRAFTTAYNFVKDKLGVILTWLREKVLDPLSTSFSNVVEFIKGLVEKFSQLQKKFDVFKLPAWMKPGSPTPFELGIRGISSAIKELSDVDLPKMGLELNALPGGGGTDNSESNTYFTMNVSTRAETPTVVADFSTMVALEG